ncbi:MAG: Rpn family recombination-promoting nuclease/putative transposase [Termitinemataceae bacterium]|nr:MAG: Rpn family recombination-promoting nuclease/putative transposase [Termitinemataceae bacterium]
MGMNSNYKSSVFSFLFSDPDALRELYGALTGITLPPETPITINTLEGVLYKTLLNDLSFVAGNKLVVLIEHQSTINPNMAIRLLMYLARVYEKITAGENLYGKKKLEIPRPEYIVLYNGVEEYPDEQIINLSDAFADAAALGLPANTPPDLELRVKVYNINRGHNESMIKRSEKLEGYSVFIAKVREIEARIAASCGVRRLSDDDKKAAMKEAINWCIGNGILKPFLETQGSEVVNMLMNEWKLEDALVVERAEGREEGLAEGWTKGRAEGREEGREEGWAKGLMKGREETVSNLLAFGIEPRQIAEALKLPLETVMQYQAKS